MQKNKIAIFVVLLMALGAFYYFWQGEQSGTELSEHDTSSANQDIASHQDTVPTRAGEDLAPGSAMIDATIISFESNNGGQHRLNVRVNEVLGYGSSTPMLAVDTDLMLNSESFFKANPNLVDTIKESTKIKAVISYQKSMTMGDEGAKGRWKLQDVRK